MGARSRFANSRRTMFARSVNLRADGNLMLGVNSRTFGYAIRCTAVSGVFGVPVTAHDGAVCVPKCRPYCRLWAGLPRQGRVFWGQ
jgi:hypothetical protein